MLADLKLHILLANIYILSEDMSFVGNSALFLTLCPYLARSGGGAFASG